MRTEKCEEGRCEKGWEGLEENKYAGRRDWSIFWTYLRAKGRNMYRRRESEEDRVYVGRKEQAERCVRARYLHMYHGITRYQLQLAGAAQEYTNGTDHR